MYLVVTLSIVIKQHHSFEMKGNMLNKPAENLTQIFNIIIPEFFLLFFSLTEKFMRLSSCWILLPVNTLHKAKTITLDFI